MQFKKMTSLLKRSSALQHLERQARYLHYVPSNSRTREPVREPQEIVHFYQYRYVPDIYPEIFGEAQYVPQNAYYSAPLYDWDNYIPKEFNEQWSYAPIWVYLTFGMFYVWLALAIGMMEIDSEHLGITPFRNSGSADGRGFDSVDFVPL